MSGPIPIIDQFISSNNSKDESTRSSSHFDYCVEYIVKLLDDASYVLPPEHTNSSYYGRATFGYLEGFESECDCWLLHRFMEWGISLSYVEKRVL